MREKVVRITVSFVFLYSLWGTIITKSIYSRPIFVYGAILCLMFLFGCSLFVSFRHNISMSTERKVWIPYLLVTIISYLVCGSIERTVYWGGCLALLVMSSDYRFESTIPKRFLLCTGIISLFGIGIQLLLPSFYAYYIKTLFVRYNNQYQTFLLIFCFFYHKDD